MKKIYLCSDKCDDEECYHKKIHKEYDSCHDTYYKTMGKKIDCINIGEYEFFNDDEFEI